MPVRKFRSVEEMPEAGWMDPDDPGLIDAIRECWALAAKLSPIRFPPGVYKRRSIEELNAATEAWEAAGRQKL